MERRETREERTVDLGSKSVPYLLITRDRVRVLRAEIALRTGLRVIRPEGTGESKVVSFLHSRRTWILRTLTRFDRLAAIIPDRKLAHGARVPCLGSELTLDVVAGPRRVGRLGDSLIVSVRRPTERSIRNALERWYRSEAQRDLASMAQRMAARHGLKFSRVVIRGQKTRWGSCSPAGTLSFNWRLMLAPLPAADYLVAHELAHLAEPNHSRRFWAKVESICPGWREQERWLKTFGPSLTL